MADWSDITAALKNSLGNFNELLQSDGQLKAFTTSNAIDKAATFGIKSSGSDNTLLITVTNGSTTAKTGTSKDTLFTLSALPEQWEHRLVKQPPPAQHHQGRAMRNRVRSTVSATGARHKLTLSPVRRCARCSTASSTMCPCRGSSSTPTLNMPICRTSKYCRVRPRRPSPLRAGPPTDRCRRHVRQTPDRQAHPR